jgi:hypothetical protein
MKVEIFFKININRFFIMIFTLAMSIVCQSGFAETTEAHESGEVVFNLDTTKYFTHYREQIKRFAKNYNPHDDNEFCIIGYYDTTKRDIHSLYRANIYWRQGHEVIFWFGGDNENDLAESYKSVDLLNGLATSKKELDSGVATYTKKWASDVIKDCYKYGKVIKFTPSDFSK